MCMCTHTQAHTQQLTDTLTDTQSHTQTTITNNYVIIVTVILKEHFIVLATTANVNV